MKIEVAFNWETNWKPKGCFKSNKRSVNNPYCFDGTDMSGIALPVAVRRPRGWWWWSVGLLSKSLECSLCFRGVVLGTPYRAIKVVRAAHKFSFG